MAGQQGQPKYGFGWPDGRLGGLGPPGSTTPAECIYDKDSVLLNLVTKKCSCLYMLRQGPYIAVYIYTERCVTMQVFCGLTAKCFGGNYNCDKISAVCMGARRSFSRGGPPYFLDKL